MFITFLHEPKLICKQFKRFQVLLSNTNNPIQYQ